MISAVVVNWNGREHLARCLPALLAQEPAPGEVLLVDNASDDGSVELVRTEWPAVRVVAAGGNLGPAAARNLGAAHARGDRLLFLDNDVVLRPGVLAELARELESDRRIGAVQPRSVCADRVDVVHYDAADLHALGTLVLHNWFRPLAEVRDPSGPVGAVIALCLLMRRRAFDAAGRFDPHLFILYEDNDLSWRLRMHGWHLRLATRAIVEHAGGTAGLSFRSPGARYASRRAFLHARNRWLVLLRDARWRTLALMAPSHVAYALVYTVFAASRGGLLAALRGHLAAVAALPRVVRARRVQRGRKVADRHLLSAAPMTANPGLAESGPKAWLRRALDGFVALNWRLVRRLCG
ncbi:MAG: glycosyltransferase family 2 protein [Planctomycetes bacterium]|nr:glycosyltransferase family 2 protein [Planctomycetota bacterium]